jgi:predicted transposase/invertase (TIGR01784 family)
MRVGIDPKVDYAFKRVFGRDHPLNRRILISLLDAVLRLPPGEQITDVQLLNPFHKREALDERLAVVDVKVRDQRGRQYTVEMQMLAHPFLPERLLYYWAKLYPQPLTSGQDYEVLRPTFVICFLNDVLWGERPQQYHWRFQLRDEQQPGVVLTPHLQIDVLELPKFQQGAEELGEPLEQWLYFLQHAEDLDTAQVPPRLQVTEIQQALEELHMLSQNDLEREQYEARLRVQRDESIKLKAARLFEEAGYKRGREQGLTEGHELGLTEGRELGLTEGRELGLTEGKAIGFLEAQAEMIQRMQRMLKRPVTPLEELRSLSAEGLQALAEELEKAAGPAMP